MIIHRNITLTFIILCLSIFIASCDRQTDITSVGDSLPPGVPENVTITDAFDGEVWIRWSKNVEVDFDYYSVYRKDNDSSDFILLEKRFTNSYYDDSLAYDQTYTYAITATDEYGNESNLSDTLKAKPINIYTPYPPRRVNINARNWNGEKYVFLSWDTYLPESDVIGYEIFRSDSAGFEPDSAHYICFTEKTAFSDTSAPELYKEYFYKIRTIDKGELKSSFTDEVSDLILPVPEIIAPVDNAETIFFTEFLILALNMPAQYEIVIQENPLTQDIWRNSLFSDTVEDTLAISVFDAYLSARTTYYWRVITYTNGNDSPNSISKPYQFIITDWF